VLSAEDNGDDDDDDMMMTTTTINVIQPPDFSRLHGGHSVGYYHLM